jgi:hypothetical protein
MNARSPSGFRPLRLGLMIAAAMILGGAGVLCLLPAKDYAGPDLLTAPAQIAPASGPLRRSDANPRYFSDATGRTVYLTGAHTWNSLQDIGESDPPAEFDFDEYLAFLRSHRMNFIRLWRWELPRWTQPKTNRILICAPQPWARTGPGKALDGKPKFDLAKFDDAYFERLRTRVEAAGKQGVYVSIMLFEGWEVRFSPADWRYHPFNAANNVNGIDGDANGDGSGLEMFTDPASPVARVQRAYVRHVIDTVNDLDNVLYEIANENAPASFSKWQTQLVRYIRQYEAGKPRQHPVGVTSSGHGNKGDLARLLAAPADWISPNPDDKDYLNNPPAADGAKVVISDTDHLWGLGGDRQWVWKSFVRGNNPIFMDPYHGAFLERREQESQWESARRALGQTAYFAARMNLAAMTPQPELASSGYCLANPGTEYLVYLPATRDATGSNRLVRGAKRALRNFQSHFAGSIEVDLTAAKGTLAVEWLDPANGRRIDGAAVRGGAKATFDAPFAGDAVLYLHESEGKPL